MENSLKQRIVGAVVLIALAIIFLPAILKEKTEQKPFKSEIPEKPSELIDYKISETAHEKNKQVQANLDKAEAQLKQVKQNFENNTDENIADSSEGNDELAGEIKKKVEASIVDISDKKVASETVISNSETEKTNSKNQAKATGFKDSAWIIQVASFSNLENAEKLVSRLKVKKHKAYQRGGKNSKGQQVYRIFVGPYIEKANANKQIAAISKISGSNALVKSYDPIKH